MIQGHGDDIYNYAGIEVNFSSNINPSGMNDALLEHLRNSLNTVTAYPQPLAGNLSLQISELRDIPSGNILVTNGAVEALYLTASLQADSRSLIYTPSFAEYEDACTIYNHQIEFHDNAFFSDNESFNRFSTVWIGNPNNPDGKIIDTAIIKKLTDQNPDTLFVIDEAYIDFIKNPQSLVQEACRKKNLAVVCSLTKKYAVPGLRIGYLVSHSERIGQIKQKLMPWRINAVAIEAGLFCLSGKNLNEFRLSEWLTESKRVQAAVNELTGFSVLPSDTIFFLVKSPVKAAILKHELAVKNKLLIRDASNFRGLTDYHFRVSVRTAKENQLLINALKEWE